MSEYLRLVDRLTDSVMQRLSRSPIAETRVKREVIDKFEMQEDRNLETKMHGDMVRHLIKWNTPYGKGGKWAKVDFIVGQPLEEPCCGDATRCNSYNTRTECEAWENY